MLDNRINIVQNVFTEVLTHFGSEVSNIPKCVIMDCAVVPLPNPIRFWSGNQSTQKSPALSNETF